MHPSDLVWLHSHINEQRCPTYSFTSQLQPNPKWYLERGLIICGNTTILICVECEQPAFKCPFWSLKVNLFLSVDIWLFIKFVSNVRIYSKTQLMLNSAKNTEVLLCVCMNLVEFLNMGREGCSWGGEGMCVIKAHFQSMGVMRLCWEQREERKNLFSCKKK